MDLGRLVATLQLVGAQAFSRDARTAEQSVDRLGDSAEQAGASTDELTDAQRRAAQAGDEATASNDRQTAAQRRAAVEARRRAREEAEAARELADAQTLIGGALATTGAAVLAMVGVAVSKYAEFDKAMSEVRATVQGSVESQNALRDAAIEAGSSTAYSATEAAQAETELAKAGVQVKDILSGGLGGSLALAAAGQLAVADAAELAATAMVQFRLSGSDIPHVADLLAAGAGKAQGSVGDLGAALNQAGLVASQMGLDVDETTGILAEFANAGLVGSDAGTSFRTMLLALANPSKESAKLMKELGINAYDASGNMVSMQDLAGQLASQLGGLTQAQRDQALAQIFGSDAIRAASVLYNDGAEGVSKWAGAVNDAGYAAQQAAMLQDNLAGDTEKLGGAFDTAFIQSGGAANDAIRELVQGLTFLVNAYAGLPPGMQQVVTIGGALVGGIALIGGTALVAVPKVLEFRAALATLNTAGTGALGSLRGIGAFMIGPWGVALAVGTAILGAFIQAQAEAQQRVDSYRASLDQSTGSMTNYTNELVVQNLAAKQSMLWWKEDSVYDAAKKVGLSIEDVTAAAKGNAEALERVNEARAKGITGPSWLSLGENHEWRVVTEAIDENKSALETAREQQEQMNEAALDATGINDENAAATEGAAQAYQNSADATSQARDALEQLMASIDEYNGLNQDSVAANATWMEGIDGLSAAIKSQKEDWNKNHDAASQWSGTLNEATAVGAANADMLNQQAQNAQNAAQAQYQLDLKTMSAKDATDKYVGTLGTSRQKLVDAAVAAGLNADEVQGLIDKVLAVPDTKATKLLVEKAAATAAIDQFVRDLNNIPGKRDVVINQMVKTTGADRGLVGAAYNANGGMYSTIGGGAGIVKAFANGGFENHVAQYAAGGTYRMWAEDETEGEVYIPMAASKRSRSTQLLQQTAGAFGYELTPAGSSGTAGLVGLGISGTMTVNGLEAMIHGTIVEAFTEQDDIARAGVRT